MFRINEIRLSAILRLPTLQLFTALDSPACVTIVKPYFFPTILELAMGR